MLGSLHGMGFGFFNMGLGTRLVAGTQQSGGILVALGCLLKVVGGLHVMLLRSLSGSGVVVFGFVESHFISFRWRESFEMHAMA